MPCVRPIPLSFTPPCGTSAIPRPATRVVHHHRLRPRVLRATRSARAGRAPHTRRETDLLAFAIPPPRGRRARASGAASGPNVSSRSTRSSGGTSTSSGRRHERRRSAGGGRPAAAMTAPRARRVVALRYERRPLRSGGIIGPTSVSGRSAPAPTLQRAHAPAELAGERVVRPRSSTSIRWPRHRSGRRWEKRPQAMPLAACASSRRRAPLRRRSRPVRARTA